MTKIKSNIFKLYFNKVQNIDDSYIIYNYCSHNFKFKGGRYQTFRKHIENKHPT